MSRELREGDRLDAIGDHATGEGVAHVVEGEVLDPGEGGGGLEAALADVAVPERCPLVRGEDGILVA